MFTKEIMETFTELDLSVYDCIVKNRDRVSRMTIKELADTVNSSSSIRNISKANGTRSKTMGQRS